MRGYIRLKLDEETQLFEVNDLFAYEVDRYFRKFIPGSSPGSIDMGADIFFKGAHTLDTLRHPYQRNEYYSAITDAVSMVTTGEVMRHRRKGTRTNLAPAQPGQIGFALGRIFSDVDSPSIHSPQSILSSVDIDLGQIGSVFGHPAGRRAFFNETAVTPTGVGNLLNGGTVSFGNGEEGHYIYDVRIAEDGDDIGAEYWWRRRPYLAGCFEAGAGEADNFFGADTLAQRIHSASSKSSLDMERLVPDIDNPTPAGVPYQVNFPTTAGSQTNLSSRLFMAFDGLSAGRMWMATVDIVDAGNGNASASRALWAWKRMTFESINRYDAPADAGGDKTMPNFPTVPAGAQFRDIKAGRGGLMYLAVDGDDDDSLGTAENGALIIFDANPITGTGDDLSAPSSDVVTLDDAGASFPTNIVDTFVQITSATNPANNGTFRVVARTSGTSIDFVNPDGIIETSGFTWTLLDSTVGVINVVGTTVVGIYDTADLLSNDILAITVDRTESYAAANNDRVWVLHRNGLTFFDINVTTQVLGARETVANAGADFNPIALGSIRGLGGFTPIGSSGTRNEHQALLDHDSNGDVYYVSTQTGGIHSDGINRLNRIIGDASAHTFYSLDTVAEGAATGFLEMGNNATGAVVFTIVSLQVHRRDVGDPDVDDIWVSTGYGNNSATSRNVAQIPIDTWATGDNPGVGYFGDVQANSATNNPFFLSVSPDGSVVFHAVNNSWVGLLESLGRFQTDTGTGDQITLDGGGAGIARLDDAGASFSTNLEGKRILITNASNAANNGSFVVTTVQSGTQLDYEHATAVNETSSFTWDFIGVDFDTQTTVGGGVGLWTNGPVNSSVTYNWFQDDSGLLYTFSGRDAATLNWSMHHHVPISYQWSGSEWYRSRVPHGAAAATRTAHVAQEELTSGVTIAFEDSGAGGTEFVQDEDYTFGVSIGLIKTATQEFEWSFDLFNQKTDLFNRGDEAVKTCLAKAVRAGFITAGSLASVETDDPFILSARAADQGAHYERRFPLDGGAGENSETVQTTGTVSTVNGFQLGVDVGSDVIASSIRFGLADIPADAGENIQIDLYSATEADGPDTWGSPRATYRSDTDGPEWIFQSDAYRNITASDFATPEGIDIEIDIEALETNGNLANPGTNDAMRFWKIAIFRHVGSAAVTTEFLGCVVFDTSGLPIGVPADRYLSFANDTNYLANFIIRAVFIEDDGAGSAARNPADNQVTLTADLFDILKTGTGDDLTADTPAIGSLRLDDAGATGINAFTANDVGRYLRISGAGNGENNSLFRIFAVNSGTQVDLESFGDGTGDSFALGIGNEVILTDSAAFFNPNSVGTSITIAGAGSGANDGTFPITRVLGPTQIVFTNAAGVAEAFAGTWEIQNGVTETSGFTWTLDGVAPNDFFRELDAAGNVVQERTIDTVDSETQLTMFTDLVTFAAEDWEVVRTADVRPRDDDGASEDAPRFPPVGAPGQGELFLCPVTGWISPNEDDVAAARQFRIERIVKVRRSL